MWEAGRLFPMKYEVWDSRDGFLSVWVGGRRAIGGEGGKWGNVSTTNAPIHLLLFS